MKGGEGKRGEKRERERRGKERPRDPVTHIASIMMGTLPESAPKL